MKSHAEGSSGPRVSITAGWKTCVVGKAAYFSALRFAAWTDAGPTDAACGKMYDAAHVWTTVASNARYIPVDQGTRVAPSGLLPSVPNRPAGSRVLGDSGSKEGPPYDVIYCMVTQGPTLGPSTH